MVWLCTSAVALAEPQDCNGSAWIAKLNALDPSTSGLVCKPESVTTDLGVNLRLAQLAAPDGGSELPASEITAWQPLVIDSAKTSLEKYRGLVSTLPLHDVTFVLRPVTYPGQVIATTALGPQSECQIIVSTLEVAAENRAAMIPTTIAHELAHCLQGWTVPAARSLNESLRNWWVEGSAEYLGNVVFENAKSLAADAEKLRAGNGPLTAQDYGMALFFAWYAQSKATPAAVFSAWNSMPTSGGDAEQRAALLGLATTDGLQQFARGWVDGTIQMPSGKPIAAPQFVPVQITSQSTSYPVSGVAFGLMGGTFQFVEDGVWTLSKTDTSTPALGFNEAKSWGALPATGSQCALVKYAGVPTGPSTPKLELTATQSKPTADACMSSPPSSCTPFFKTKDSCLTGEWTFDTDASTAQINADLGERANPKASVSGSITLTLSADTTAANTFTDFDLSLGTDATSMLPPTFEDISATGSAQGNWSFENGVLRICPSTDTVQLTTSVQVFYGSFNPVTTVSFSGATLSDTPYTCSGNTLTLTPGITSGSGAPVKWIFHKKGGGGCTAVPGPLELLAVGALLLSVRRRRG